MNDYLEKSGRAMLAACLTYYSARSAEKMADWHCVGEDNEAWKGGPYLSAGANQKQIDRSHSYCFKTSREFGVVAGIVMGSNPERSENGGVKTPLPSKDMNGSRVEPVISKLAIIEQFELFKEFLITFDGPCNIKRCSAWEGRVEKTVLDTVRKLTNRRNELTHDFDHKLPSMKEAMEYFYCLRQISLNLYEAD
ncbi:hypothetical protein BZG82_15980 [Salinivibrio sp. PR5]|uniref:hypothetical protein n=1 Tax=Salinivibrio sp. PR5 TaxID=1909484 RepID=UPI00098A4BD1|nr:hypothetical protein [Salinivibrio sp. PR5]OOF07869.1 hypothetical protein BZG82_15980 [Salinivibrio sp. PR5]